MFLNFLFENEVLGYNGGIPITKALIFQGLWMPLMDAVSETGLVKFFVAMIKFLL